MTDYETKLAEIHGRVGTNDAYVDYIRPKVERAIDEKYPDLVVAEVDES